MTRPSWVTAAGGETTWNTTTRAPTAWARCRATRKASFDGSSKSVGWMIGWNSDMMRLLCGTWLRVKRASTVCLVTSQVLRGAGTRRLWFVGRLRRADLRTGGSPARHSRLFHGVGIHPGHHGVENGLLGLVDAEQGIGDG